MFMRARVGEDSFSVSCKSLAFSSSFFSLCAFSFIKNTVSSSMLSTLHPLRTIIDISMFFSSNTDNFLVEQRMGHFGGEHCRSGATVETPRQRERSHANSSTMCSKGHWLTPNRHRIRLEPNLEKKTAQQVTLAPCGTEIIFYEVL